MLILSRRVDERIVIGDDIEIAIVDIKGDIIKIGIDAPPNIRIYRREVFDEIQAENRAAALSSGKQLPSLKGYLSPKPKSNRD